MTFKLGLSWLDFDGWQHPPRKPTISAVLISVRAVRWIVVLRLADKRVLGALPVSSQCTYPLQHPSKIAKIQRVRCG